MGIHNLRVDENLWKSAKDKVKMMNEHGWSVSMSDILRGGLLHFLGRANIDQMFNSKEDIKAGHVEDVSDEQ